MSLPTIQQVVSRYLFNQDAPPEELVDENLIRAKDANGDPIYVEMNEFMTAGAGRFVGVERFLLVRNFLGGHEDSYLGAGNKLPPGQYTTEQLLAAYGKTLEQAVLGVSGYYHGVYEPDYAERAYIFGSGSYRINLDAIFYVNEDGSREIVDICVEPVDDNFDYKGEGILADVTNYLTEDEIDPSGIGRQVPIVFTGSVSEKQCLTSEDWYLLDILNEAARLAESASMVAVFGNIPYFGALFGSVLGGLFGNDIITFEDGEGKYVVYDGESLGNDGVVDPLLLMNLAERLTYDQVVVVAGNGNDTIYGVGGSGDELYGGAGNDHLDGRLGADRMEGGSDDDTYIADDERDVVVERADEGVDLVKSSITYTLSENVENLELTGSNNIGGTGNALDNFMQGNEAGNTLSGEAGNDDIFGHSGNDTLLGMDDNDRLYGGGGDDILDGGAGNDILDGGSGNDILKGGAGEDTYIIDGSAGNDTIIDLDKAGGTIKYKDHVLSGGKAISAGAQQWKDDHVTYSVVSDGSIQNLIITVGASTVTVLDWHPGKFGIQLEDAEEPVPINADQVIEGDKKPIDFDSSQEGVQSETDELGNIKTDPDKDDPDRYDYLQDSAGNDKLLGKGGDDTLYAHRGGNDLLDGGSGDDWLLAGDGDDTLVGGSGSDRLGSGTGDDRLYADEEVTDEQAFVANAIDNGIAERGSRLSGDADKDFLVGGQRQDLLLGGSGRDILLGGAGDDVLYGDSLATWSTFEWAVARRVETDEESQITTYWVDFVDMGTMVPSESDEDGDFLYGGTGADWLFGESGQDYLDGGASDDVLFGGRDSDWLVGGDGSDVLVGDSGVTPTGQDGDDLLIGGAGNDTLVGDGGNDILHGGDDHDLLSGDNDKIDPALHGDDHLDGGSGNDKLYGHGGADTLEGGEGHDLLLGDQMEQALAGAYHARDVLHGGAGNDTLFGTGSDDELYGGDDDDVLNGDADASQLSGQYHGNDLLDGGSGSDQLWGNGGSDTLYGGAGSDRLVGDAEGLAGEFHGNDRLYAGAGNDSIWGGGGDDLLDGDEGDDQLVGDSGNDTLVSGSGDDRLWGGEGNDRLDGGSGFDYLDGGEGDDTYVFNLGDGHLSVEGNTEFIQDTAGANSLEFGAGIDVDAIQLTQYPGMLQLRYSAEDSLILMGGLGSGVNSIRFADGSVFSLEALYARNSQDSADLNFSVAGAQLVGSASGNQLTGTGGGSTFRGGRGDDTLSGAGGGNLYLYERGDGIDHIYDTAGNSLPDGTPAPNRVQFGTGIRPQDVSLAPGIDDTLEVLIAGDPSGKLIIHGFDADDAVNSSVIDYFDFVDGTSLSYAELLGSGFQVIGSAGNDNLLGSNLSDLLQGNTGNDTLSAGGGDDVLQGGEGNDLLIGGAGADLYLYAKGQGSDTLVETADGSINTLRFAAGLNPEDIELGAGADQSLLLKIVSSGDTLVLASWLVSATPLVQRIEFADGTVWTPEWIRQNLKVQSGTVGNDVLSALFGQSATLYGLAGNDTLNGSNGDDQLVGGVGNDSLVGGDGSDRYLIELGDGLDTLVESGGQDAVLYGAGIAASDVSVTRVGTDLLLTHINGSDRLTIKGWFSYADGRAWVEEIRFADGSVWSADELTRQVLTQVGTEGNDNLKGSENFGDTLSGGAGNDTMRGYSGDDSLSGGAGYDYLYGGNGNDTLTVGGGGGYAEGGLGDDLYLYNGGDGVLSVGDSGGNDTVRFGEGIQAEDVKFQRQGNSLSITLADGGQIVLNDWFYYADGSRMIERFQFADDTTLTATELNQILLTQEGTMDNDSLSGTGLGDTLIGAAGDDYLLGYGGNDVLRGDQGHDWLDGGDGDDLLEGGEGNDRLYSGAGNDSLDGGAGNDYLVGGAGDDNYLAIGEGHDRILDAAGLDSLYFTAEIRPEQLIITRVNADLHIGFAGRDDSVTLLEWFRTPQNSIERFIFADGSQWGTADIGTAFSMISGNGSLNGSEGDDLLYGGAGSDTLNGDAGNDLLDGGAGADSLVGGAGDDTYIADAGDTISELPGGGVDTLVWTSSAAATLQDELENLVLTESAGYSATGNSADNYIIGNSQGNYLNGNGGADTMVGGLGNDSYYVDDAGDLVIERANEGKDRVNASITYSLPENIESLTLMGSTVVDGFGNDLDNYLTGNEAGNQLSGSAGNDSLSGGLGADTLIGGVGSDSYYLNAYDDALVEGAGEGYDRIYISGIDKSYGSPWYVGSFSMDENVEYLRMTSYVTHANVYGNGQDNVVDARGAKVLDSVVGNTTWYYLAKINIYGGDGNDTLYSADGDSTLDGGLGDDLMYGGQGANAYYVDSEFDEVVEISTSTAYRDSVWSSVSYTLGANLEELYLLGSANLNGTGNEQNNSISGNSGDNLLVGGAGDDRLIGGAGVDTLVGGIGNDTYVLTSTSDLLQEYDGEGIDKVETGFSYSLDSYLENLTLTGTAVIDGTGNELDNLIYGNSANNKLVGGFGHDTLTGWGGNDNLQGDEGDDVLDGGMGNDTMQGGVGNDSYYVDSTKDVVVEDAGEGIDTVYSSIAYTLDDDLENLTIIGGAAIKGTGNALDNKLNGNSAANSLSAGGGNDTLDGGAGNDTLIGGLGDDTYLLGRGYGTDTVRENDASTGNYDVVRFLADVSVEQLWFREVGKGKNTSLEVSVIGTDDKLIIDKWYAGDQFHIERFETDDGRVLMDSQVQNLVNAMASFSPPVAGQTALPEDYQTSLGTLIAANWQ